MMNSMEKLEKLVEAKISFQFTNLVSLNTIEVVYHGRSDDSLPSQFIVSTTLEEAITALYSAAVKAYPERMK